MARGSGAWRARLRDKSTHALCVAEATTTARAAWRQAEAAQVATLPQQEQTPPWLCDIGSRSSLPFWTAGRASPAQVSHSGRFSASVDT